ncbi:MAG: integration host factor subunit beta [Methylobacter sp.]|nr:integration host factor subunit beta [Methylobacter sp.]MDP2100025.1 integration host factor subunit beta [Methylobacter sp.]MDP2427838.1 integration host factor subunit beta [Methylobacter sp.]MDP3055292.1 integration host factor subunit beta [Methylobacter sp.]MDP3362440.1 integration host factor subunit beta [Methylobacter sp.]
MVKSELVRVLSTKQPDMDARDVELAINCMLEQMSTALEQGERIEIRGFGSFSLHHIPARTTRNPKTGAAVQSPAKVTIHFKPGKETRNRVNATHGKCKILD